MIKDKTEEIQEVIKPILDSMRLELVGLEISGRGRGLRLRVYVEKEKGVTLDDCEMANRFIGHALDVADLFEASYTLEVSSPGLDRPLKTPADFRRYRGRLARLQLADPGAGSRTLIGRIREVSGDRVEVESAEGPVRSVSLLEIARARLEVEW